MNEDEIDDNHFSFRLSISIGALLVALICLALVWHFMPRHASRDAEKVQRLDTHCTFIRLQLEQELGRLNSMQHQGVAASRREFETNQFIARRTFEDFIRNDWREVVLCAPEGVSVANGCALDDVPCMTLATWLALDAVRIGP